MSFFDDIAKAAEGAVAGATQSVQGFINNQVYEPLARVVGMPTGNLSEAQIRAGQTPKAPSIPAPISAPAQVMRAMGASENTANALSGALPIIAIAAAAYFLFSKRGR